MKEKEFILRHPRKKDIKGFYETETDVISKKMFESFPKNIDEAKKDLQKHIKDNNKKPIVSETFTIEIKGKYAGYVKIQHQNFEVKNDEGRIHIAIHPKFRRKELATSVTKKIIDYGFKKYRFKRIYCQCKTINKNVAKITKKLGFEKVKTYINEEGISKTLFVKEKSK